MFPLVHTTFVNEFDSVQNQATFDSDQLFRDEQLRPDPMFVTIRKGVTALLGLFTRSQETDPVATESTPLHPITTIAPIATHEGAARIAA